VTTSNFSNNFDYKAGGAVNGDYNISVNHCKFLNNSANSGGAVLGSNVVVMDSVFIDNVAFNSGGALFGNANSSMVIQNCAFHQNAARSEGDAATSSNGGAIYATSLTALNITASVFANNSATAAGGAIYMFGSDDIFGSGQAAISNIYVTQCQFDMNSAASGGGILSSGTVTNTSIQACIFKFNSATSAGGALSIQGGSLISDNNIFDNNSAQSRGGAIFGDSGSVMQLSNSNFTDNNSTGKAYFNPTYFTPLCTLTLLIGRLYSLPHATGSGGGVASTNLVTMQSCNFTGNRATLNGGKFV
jgi:predicted outer membrane repeat protein